MRLKLPASPASFILSTIVILCQSISKANGLVLISNTDSSPQRLSENIVAIDERTGNFLGEFIPKGEGGLKIPDNLLFGPDGNLYVSSGGDSGANIFDPSNSPSAILRYEGKTGKPLGRPSTAKGSAVFASGGGLIRPYGAAFGPDGNLYVSSFRTNQILCYNGKTGKFIGVFASDNNSGHGSVNGLNGPNGLLFGPDGSLYVATEGTANDSEGNLTFPFDSQVLRYSPEQVIGEKSRANPGVFVQQPNPLFGYISFLGLALGPQDGNIYVSDFSNNVRVYTPTGALVRTISTYYSGTIATGDTNSIGYLAFAPNGKDLYTVGIDNTMNLQGSVLGFKDAQGDANTFTGQLFPSIHLARPIGIAFPPDEYEKLFQHYF